MILDSEQNSNYLNLFICLTYLQVPNLEISITLMKCENGTQALISKNIDIDGASHWRKPDACYCVYKINAQWCLLGLLLLESNS